MKEYINIIFGLGIIFGATCLYMLYCCLNIFNLIKEKNKSIRELRNKYKETLNDKDCRKYNKLLDKIEGVIKNDKE